MEHPKHTESPTSDVHCQALERVAMAAIKEQRHARRWRIVVQLGILFLLLFVCWRIFLMSSNELNIVTDPHTALIRIDGPITADSRSNAENILIALNDAFSNKGTAGVILQINSPGGTPVQAGEVYDEIMQLRKKYPKVPVYTVAQDVCASGAYYIASASNQIFVNRASVVGSIGVLMSSFGFSGLMEKLGVQRRLNISGKNKGFYDPFSPETPEMKVYAQKMLDELHVQFIDAVKAGRGERLHETPDIFSGLMWTGAESIKLGLADGFGNTNWVAKEVIKQPRIIDYTFQEGFADRFVKKFGVAIGTSMMQHLFSVKQSLNFD